MLTDQTPSLQSAAETLYQLNMDEQLRETCDRFIRAEARENAIKRLTTKLQQDNAELTQTNTELANANTELTNTVKTLNAEVARLKAIIESQN